MSSRARLMKIEAELDLLYDRPQTPEVLARIEVLEKEADDIAEDVIKVEELIRKREREEQEAKAAKLEDIRRLNKEGRMDELVAKYGHEFIDDYHVDGNTITSKVAREDQNSQWTEEDVDAKLRQLLYYRIYDNYIRERS